MIPHAALLLAAAPQGIAPPALSGSDPAAGCVAETRSDPAAAETRARRGGAGLRACLALALAAQDRYAEAGTAFAEAARGAELAHDSHAADYWAQAGNAWLAAGDAAKARGALDAALAAGTLVELQRGEAHLDRARALVALGDTAGARTDLDQALTSAGDDPLAWLLSATLARRGGDLGRARADIAQALRRSADDASVQLEAGNIAAAGGDADRAKAAWQEAARLAPDSPAGQSAAQALTQFGGK